MNTLRCAFHALLLTLLVMGPGSGQAAEDCRAAGPYTPRLCPSGLPAVRAVVIETNGQPSPGPAQPFSNCNGFVMTQPQVKRYFMRAWRIDDARGESALDRGPCEARGRVWFADGRAGQWRIEQIGTGTFVMDGDAAALMLFCARCRLTGP